MKTPAQEQKHVIGRAGNGKMIKIKLAKSLKEREKFIGGAADGMPDSDFDPEILKKGIEKEKHDHGLNDEEADEIAKDELVLDPEGYTDELKEVIENKSLNFYVLIGPPAVGKSTWIQQNFEDKGKEYKVIGKDQIIEKLLSKIYGFTAANLYKKDKTPEEAQALQELEHMFNSVFGSVLDNRTPNVIVDMMNVDKRARTAIIDKVKDRYPEYKIIAVKFEFEGHEDDVIKSDAERAKKRAGERVAIDPAYIVNAMRKFKEQPPTPEEGFDEIITYNRFKEPQKMNEDYNHKQFIEWLNSESEKKETNDKLLVEAKLSVYWRKRAARRAKNGERQWPNKIDRDWALKEQEKSLQVNDSVHKLFEKELEESEEMLGEIDYVMTNIRKERKKKAKMKQETQMLKPQDRVKKKKSLSKPLKPEYGGVAKGARKHAKQQGGPAIAPGESFGPMEEEKKNENN